MGSDEFRKIFEAHADAALRVAIGILGDPCEAEDVVQEVFVGLYRALPALRSAKATRAYVYRATVRKAFSALRHRQRTRAEIVPVAGRPTEGLSHDPQRELETEEVHRVVFRLLSRLPVRQRAAFLLHDVEGLDMGEVARMIGCAGPTARVHFHLARKALREMIEREYPELVEGLSREVSKSEASDREAS